MSSAFKNFFITFAVCLLIFSFLGLKYVYPWANSIVDFSNIGDKFKDTSTDESVDVSENVDTSTETKPEYDENGDVFTAVVMIVDSNGRAVDTVFINANAKTKNYVYCRIPSTVKAINEVGVMCPVGDLFATMTPEAVCKSVTAMTGIETQYCLRFTREDLVAIVEADTSKKFSVSLDDDIIIPNPKYADLDITKLPEGQKVPDDYYLTISSSKDVILYEEFESNRNIEWLLFHHNPYSDGSEYNVIYKAIGKAMMRQFLANENTFMNMNNECVKAIFKNCDTNLTMSAMEDHITTLFRYDDPDFKYHELNLPNSLEDAIEKMRELDGSFD